MFFGFALIVVAAILIDAAVSKRSIVDVIDGVHTTNVSTGGGTDTSITPGGSTALPTGSAGTIAHDAYAALTPERIDQGKDFGGAGTVNAIANGVVVRNTLWPGWPGTGGVVYTTTEYGNIYVMEDFTATVHIGQLVKAGEPIGNATGGSNGIESGLANATATGPRTPYNGAPDGTQTAGGKAFAALIGY